MKDDLNKLKTTLERLETSVEKILSTRGYTRDAKRLKLLQEIIREQLIQSNTRSSTRTLR